MRQRIIIGTRGSSLSLCQTRMVQARLEERHPDRQFAIKTIKAAADRNPEVPLVALGGEGVFVKELEAALLAGEVDLAVHSMKDLPLQIPGQLVVAAVTEREDAHDALISRSGQPLEDLPAGSRIGTSSLRRRSQLLHQRRDVELLDIRGNVDTRLRKLAEGRYDAVVLAAAGLIRLGLEERITQYLPMEWMLPEPGQGALGIEARADDGEVLEMLRGLDDEASRRSVEAERAFLGALGGGCHVPIAAYAQVSGGTMTLDGAVCAPDGSRRLRDRLAGPADAPERLGSELAQRLSARGAKEILETTATRL